MESETVFETSEVIKKFNLAGPRYTSYPSAAHFRELSNQDSTNNLLNLQTPTTSLYERTGTYSLYIHIPFCQSLCYYCACNKIVTQDSEKLITYLSYLKKEIDLKCEEFSHLQLSDVHFGGGTPSTISIPQMRDLIHYIHSKFNTRCLDELSIEVDPRTADSNYIIGLSEIGFNRISFGVQDVNHKVQNTINRVQCTHHLQSLITAAKQSNFRSVNIDLIYGLPHQTFDTINHTIESVKIMDPERISLFSYAHMPNLFAAQRKIPFNAIPDANSKLKYMIECIEQISALGYNFIGMDHFAKDDDDLSISAKDQSLHRNFQGYTPHRSDFVLGLGVSAISDFGMSYTQNTKSIKQYYAGLDENKAPFVKAYQLNQENVIHRELIEQLMCNFMVDKVNFSKRHCLVFDDFFSDYLNNLDVFTEGGLVEQTRQSIKIKEHARLLVRNICMSFDEFMFNKLPQFRYSQLV